VNTACKTYHLLIQFHARISEGEREVFTHVQEALPLNRVRNQKRVFPGHRNKDGFIVKSLRRHTKNSHNTGRFIMFSVITNICNKKAKGPTLMELFTATGKLKTNYF
jgi:hypothetical protein